MKTEEDEAFDDIAKRQGAWGGGYQAKRAMAADKLQEPAQEPIAWRWGIKKLNGGYEWRYSLNKTQDDSLPLFAAPPQRQWIWLSDADIRETIDSICQYNGDYDEFLCKKIERKIKELNT